MKRTNGFTLIELLAVIVILAIILVIAVPQINKIINSSKVSSYNNQIELIKDAVEIYKTKYIDEISNINDVTVSLNTLIEKGLIKDVKNPVNNLPFDTGMNIRARSENTETIYEVYEGPELFDGLIPVYYDESEMVWKKADKSNIDNNWYDYNSYKWANAVTVTSTTRSTYMNASVGTAILMSDINTMFVWIPRYSYKIPAGTGNREILIKFETKYTPKSNGDAINTYYTHPAFTFGSEELNGVWVGKFETTGSVSSITIKPDLYSLTNLENKAFFEAIRNIEGSETYGFGNDSDTHMMKNIEWGAVAYLSNSKYGKYSNTNYTGANKEIYLNNDSGYRTGRSMGAPGGSGVLISGVEYFSNGYYTYDGKCAAINSLIPQCASGTAGVTVLTDKTLSYGASTTGTIYGIYDMSGGKVDRVMALYYPEIIPETGIRDCSGYSTNYSPTSCPETGPFISQYDLFNGIEEKYYDRYLTTTKSVSYIKGDATLETNSWNGDNNDFLSIEYTWLYRGGRIIHASAAGIFYYSSYTGVANSNYSARVILVSK